MLLSSFRSVTHIFFCFDTPCDLDVYFTTLSLYTQAICAQIRSTSSSKNVLWNSWTLYIGLYCVEYFALEVIGLFIHLCAIKKYATLKKATTILLNTAKLRHRGPRTQGKKKKNQADQRTKGTPSFLFADLEWAESQISTLPHTRMSWTKEILTRKYEPEHAKFRNTVLGGQIMARQWYIWTATFPSFVN